MSGLTSQLTERVRIEQPARAEDEFGGSEISWSELATVFAAVKPLHGTAKKGELGDRRAASAGYRVVLRRRDDIVPTMRLVWRQRVLTIHSLHETNEILSILAYEETV